jgi:hypothetical protein
MLRVHMEKSVTLLKDFGNKTAVWTIKYRDLENELNNVDQIEVRYPYGDLKRRQNLLSKLGYELKETLYYNDECVSDPILQVWAR